MYDRLPRPEAAAPLEMADLFAFAARNGARVAQWSRRDGRREILRVEIRPGVWFGCVWKTGDDPDCQAKLAELLTNLRDLVEALDVETRAAAAGGGGPCAR